MYSFVFFCGGKVGVVSGEKGGGVDAVLVEFLTGVSDSRRASGGVLFWVSLMLVDSLVKMNLDHWRGGLENEAVDGL